MARLRWTVFVKFWGNRDPPELSRLLRGKANEPTKFWGNRDPPELSRLLRGKANRPTKFWGHRDPLELSRFLLGSAFPANRANFGGPPRAQSYMIRPDLVDSDVGRAGDDAASRSDPTVTRASQGLRQ